jgi:Tetratricopeptide repeat/Cytochrome c554 and c-prime
MTSQGCGPRPSRRVRWWAVGVVALGVAGAAAYWYWPRPAPSRAASAPLPPLTSSPFLNTQPDVAYVGDQACAGCHREQTKAYRQHPMGRSLFRADEAPPLEQFDGKDGKPFQTARLHFQVIRRDAKLIHKEWSQDDRGNVVAQAEAEIAYAIGSGSQARSYLVVRDGFLFESPITWFTDKAAWQLSPGYDKNQEHFSRRIERRCLYCHCQEARPAEHTVNRYETPPFGQLAIGCERCHGPGELHVASRKERVDAQEMDVTIVNPRHLPAALRDAVCEQCHLQGEAIVPRRGRAQSDYRPGLPLHEYVSIFVRPAQAGDNKRIVGHVEQMQESVCFTKSAGKFGCISCHDPHRLPSPEEKIAFYQGRCRNCHAAAARPAAAADVTAPDCSLPPAQRTAKSPRDDCVACHMPRHGSSAAEHLAVTDHRVLRNPDRPRPAPLELARGDLPLLAFHRRLLDPDDEALSRDLALAAIPLAAAAREFGGDQVANYLTRRALPLLDQAAARAADDVPVLEARGFALLVQRRLDNALRVFEDALDLAPDREQTLTWAAEAAAATGRLDRAEQLARRLVAKYPYFSGHHQTLAAILVDREAWPQALQAAQAGIEIDPFSAPLRDLLITIHLHNGDRDRAQAEFDRLGLIDPAYQERLRPRFAERLRSSEPRR